MKPNSELVQIAKALEKKKGYPFNQSMIIIIIIAIPNFKWTPGKEGSSGIIHQSSVSKETKVNLPGMTIINNS